MSLLSKICTSSISAMLLNRTKSCYGVQKLKINHDNNGKATTESCRRKINLKQENKTITRNNGCKERWLQTSSTFEMSFLKRQKQKNKTNEHEIRYVHYTIIHIETERTTLIKHRSHLSNSFPKK